nr:T9SS type A sorting domain-containing protein [Bacteroidota bacterium]
MKLFTTAPGHILTHILSFSHSLLRYSPKGVLWTIFLFLLFTLSLSLPAQEWTEPMNITNLGGYSMNPDMVIDHSGVIHVVWSYRIEDWHRKIMYNYSEDDVETWSEPLDLLQNTDLWMSQPHIACDSKNNLYVTYDYATGTPDKLVYMIGHDGHQWSEPIIISEGMPGSHYNNVIIDYNDRVYVFWDYGNTGDDYYRYLKNNSWSQPHCPYPGNDKIYALMEAAVSEQNSLHWIGSSIGGGYYGERLQYFFYNFLLNTWQEPQMPVEDTITVGKDISLKSGDLPECVYRTYPLPDDKTKLINKEGNYWGDPELVAGVNGTQQYQQIAVDQNNAVHIVERQKTVEGYGLVHYKKWDGNWIGQYIDTAYALGFQKLIFNNNKLYCTYGKAWEVEKEVFSDLFFVAYDIITDIKEETQQPTELRIYPNPTTKNIYIEFVPLASLWKNNKQQHIDLSVYDMTGKHIITLIKNKIPHGMQRILWNGTDKNRKEVKTGPYLVRLQSGRNTVTQIVEIIR